MHRRNFIQASCGLMGGLAYGLPAMAQDTYPSRPIKIITPFAPGSSDLIARKIGESITRRLGQPVVVETRPGAQGTIATRAVAAARNDGYTLLLGTNSTHAASVYLFKKPGYDPVKDFTPISQFTVNPLLLVVRADLPLHTVKELIAHARSAPQKLNFGAGNTGSLVAVEMLKRQAGFDAVGVNYQGNAQAIQDFLAGRLDFMATDPMIIKPFLQSGKFRVLGITTRQRLPNFPDVAPLAEQGLPDFEYASWVGLFAPAGLDAGIAAKLHQECAEALAQADVAQFLAGLGMIPARKTRQEFEAFVAEQIRLWGQWSRDAGITAS